MAANANTPERLSEVEELLCATRECSDTRVAHERAKDRLARAKRAVDKRGFPRGAWRELPTLGKRVRRRFVKGARTFSLKEYEAAGHTVTPEMEQHISKGSGYDAFDIEDASE